MGRLKDIVNKIPVIGFLYSAVRYRVYALDRMENTFSKIYKSHKWGGKDSVSGPGSDVHQTRIIINALPALFNTLNISTMLDIPCGDFHWMRSVDLNSIDYTGGDIVKEIIKKNREKYTRNGVRFQYLNLIKDKLPKVDIVFCRDCLVHFSFADIFLALENVCKSQSEYFLTTTFTGRKDNHDISTGQWRPLNLELPPFMLPKPLIIINEGCTQSNGTFEDKALGLWRISDIRERITKP